MEAPAQQLLRHRRRAFAAPRCRRAAHGRRWRRARGRAAWRRRAPARRCPAPRTRRPPRSARAALRPCFSSASARSGASVERAGDARAGEEGGVDVGLHLAERDRALGQRAVGVGDGIPTVLPALVRQPGLGHAAVLDEAVAVAVAVQSRSSAAPPRCSATAGAASPPRRCGRARRRPARRRAAWNRRCRSSAGTAPPRVPPSRRCGPRAGSSRARRPRPRRSRWPATPPDGAARRARRRGRARASARPSPARRGRRRC